MKSSPLPPFAAALSTIVFSLGCDPWEPGDVVNGTCAEPGQVFTDVYRCETVEGPAPTEPPGAVAYVLPDDATAEDEDYAWVSEQVWACSCICCHTDGGSGSYKWAADFEPSWSDSASNEVLQQFGVGGFNHDRDIVPAEHNYGFSRSETGLPTTDPDRLEAWIQRELDRRGWE